MDTALACLASVQLRSSVAAGDTAGAVDVDTAVHGGVAGDVAAAYEDTSCGKDSKGNSASLMAGPGLLDHVLRLY